MSKLLVYAYGFTARQRRCFFITIYGIIQFSIEMFQLYPTNKSNGSLDFDYVWTHIHRMNQAKHFINMVHH